MNDEGNAFVDMGCDGGVVLSIFMHEKYNIIMKYTYAKKSHITRRKRRVKQENC